MTAMTNPCPICGKPESEAVRPFCSQRCADVDLNRWLSGVYAVPVADEEKASPTLQPGQKHDDEVD